MDLHGCSASPLLALLLSVTPTVTSVKWLGHVQLRYGIIYIETFVWYAACFAATWHQRACFATAATIANWSWNPAVMRFIGSLPTGVAIVFAWGQCHHTTRQIRHDRFAASEEFAGRHTSTSVQCQCGGVGFMDRPTPCAPCAIKDIHKNCGLDEQGPTAVRGLLEIDATTARRDLIRRARCVRPRLSEESIIGFHGFRRGRAQHERRSGMPIFSHPGHWRMEV